METLSRSNGPGNIKLKDPTGPALRAAGRVIGEVIRDAGNEAAALPGVAANHRPQPRRSHLHQHQHHALAPVRFPVFRSSPCSRPLGPAFWLQVRAGAEVLQVVMGPAALHCSPPLHWEVLCSGAPTLLSRIHLSFWPLRSRREPASDIASHSRSFFLFLSSSPPGRHYPTFISSFRKQSTAHSCERVNSCLPPPPPPLGFDFTPSVEPVLSFVPCSWFARRYSFIAPSLTARPFFCKGVFTLLLLHHAPNFVLVP